VPKPPLILVVEDDIHIRDMVVEAVGQEGYRAIEACDGEEALAALSVERPNLILLDLEMPVMSGWAFMRELTARALQIPVIVMSGRADSASQLAEMGAVSFVDKPIDVPELLASIAKYHR
jgi:CheY-like chemotaxis protein